MATLTASQLEALEKQLVERRAALWKDVRAEVTRSGGEQHADLVGGVGDAGDEASLETLANLGAAMADHQVHEIREIEAALKRLRGGAYGECVDCGEAIDAARLTAYPAAARCLRCQSQHEKTFSSESA